MSPEPSISVVVSTRDRAGSLALLLESLRNQTIDRAAFEVVVVDNGSIDETPDVLDREQARGELPLEAVILPRGGGPAVGRNAGWRATRAAVVAFTDDDCEADPRWLEELLEATRANPAAIVQGRTQPGADDSPAPGVYKRTVEVNELGPFFHTCNIAYPRPLLEELGGFDEDLFGRTPGGEDTDLAWRAIEGGTEAVFADGARVVHAVNVLGPAGGLRLALRWSDTMAVFARHAGMRSHLHRRIFWKIPHELLIRALIGLVLAKRFPPAALLAYPYLKSVLSRTQQIRIPADLCRLRRGAGRRRDLRRPTRCDQAPGHGALRPPRSGRGASGSDSPGRIRGGRTPVHARPSTRARRGAASAAP